MSQTHPSPKPARPPFLVRRRTVFTWLIPIALLTAALTLHRDSGGIPAYIGGLFLIIMGEVVRFWAAGYIAKDSIITTGGPYGFVRNPLYFGSLLLSVGYGLVSGLGIWAVLIMLTLFLLFHLAAIRYEESFLKDKFGAPYLEYLARVPRLIPSPRPKTHGTGEYSWAQAIKNREHISALFAVVFVLLLSLRFLEH